MSSGNRYENISDRQYRSGESTSVFEPVVQNIRSVPHDACTNAERLHESGGTGRGGTGRGGLDAVAVVTVEQNGQAIVFVDDELRGRQS